MRKFLFAILIAVFALPASEALARRHHVAIHKSPPPAASTQPVVPLAVVPPLLIAFDLYRRTSCDPVAQVGGGPGYDRPMMPTDNAIIPAWTRGLCSAQPKSRRAR